MPEPIEIEQRSAYRCEGGCELTEEEPQGGQYECSNDGPFSGGQALNAGKGKKHQCPTCGKFGSKLADLGCDECGEVVEEINAHVCPECDELFETEAEARAHCSEDAVEARAQAAERRRIAATSVRVEERVNYKGSTSITYCDRDGRLLTEEPAYRTYIQPGTSFGITECVEHPLCQNAVETGKFCSRHQGPLTFKEVWKPLENPTIRHGAPDGPCSDEPYVYITNGGWWVEPPIEELPERVKVWLKNRDEERAAVEAML